MEADAGMIGSPALSRRTKAAILASPPRTLRLDIDARLAARRATQPEREQAYRDRQARQIHAAIAVDVVVAEACIPPVCGG